MFIKYGNSSAINKDYPEIKSIVLRMVLISVYASVYTGWNVSECESRDHIEIEIHLETVYQLLPFVQ